MTPEVGIKPGSGTVLEELMPRSSVGLVAGDASVADSESADAMSFGRELVFSCGRVEPVRTAGVEGMAGARAVTFVTLDPVEAVGALEEMFPAPKT